MAPIGSVERLVNMHEYRSHTCGELTVANAGEEVRLSGWVARSRNHGHLLFLDLRDHYGMTQCVVDASSAVFGLAKAVPLESVVTLSGYVTVRSSQTVNPKLTTGDIEVLTTGLTTLSEAAVLPMPVTAETDYPEDIRLRNRFLDLRREQMHRNIMLRSSIIQYLREKMREQGFTEFQTPILTASSPEGARDFLVPSRLNPGKFYALPQAPQLFKQMLMVAGFDKYFQIAPCFRDEDGRADRSPTEFYQLDLEMSFATQDDVFAALEPVLHGVFANFGGGKVVTAVPFPRIAYDVAMLQYGTDKPDLRNPLKIADVTEIFRDSAFEAFSGAIRGGSIVRAIAAPGCSTKPRRFYDRLVTWIKEQGAAGLTYLVLRDNGAQGPVAKFLTDSEVSRLRHELNAGVGDGMFFVCARKSWAEKFAGALRRRLGEELQLIVDDEFRLCWIVDFPMYQLNEDTNRIEFSHNPFSMPQGGLRALMSQDPLSIKAFQYDIVCNGYELSSGAIRNHVPEIMFKAFEIAGYGSDYVEEHFGGLLRAFRYGAPPHGGSAPGIDRIVMLLAGEQNLREVVAFPTTQKGEDLLMQAPSIVSPSRLNELHIKVDLPENFDRARLFEPL